MRTHHLTSCGHTPERNISLSSPGAPLTAILRPGFYAFEGLFPFQLLEAGTLRCLLGRLQSAVLMHQTAYLLQRRGYEQRHDRIWQLGTCGKGKSARLLLCPEHVQMTWVKKKHAHGTLLYRSHLSITYLTQIFLPLKPQGVLLGNRAGCVGFDAWTFLYLTQ